MKDKTNEPKPDVIAGRNPVSEAIRSGRPIDKILVARGEKTGAVVGILAKAREKQIPVKEADRVKLDFLSGSAPHQGIIALAAAKEYSKLEDPHNLGAIIRTAECVGAHGVIIPKRRSVGLSYTVGKASAGAVEYMRVARVTNIANLLDDLKKQGVWIYGADMNGAGDRQRGQGHGAFGARKVRRDRFAAHEGTYQFFERLGRRRYPDVPRAAGQKIERM